MSNRFHNKFHRHNHHTTPTDRSDRYPDSAYDPIASPEAPFRGEFYVDGNITTLSSVSVAGNLSVQGGATQLNSLVHITSAVDIITNTNLPSLTITQMGNGYALKVNDSNNSDISPFAIDKEGHVLVGTLSAKNAYELVAGVSNPSFFIATLSAQGNDSGLYVKSVNGVPFYVEDGTGNDTSPFIIDKDGKVGIRTKYPKEALTVAGNISASGNISSDKQFLAASGTASAPSIACNEMFYLVLDDGSGMPLVDQEQNDLILTQANGNNGIYFPAENTLGFVTAGVDRMVITSTGNVSAAGNIRSDYGFFSKIGKFANEEGNDYILLEPSDDSVRFILNNSEKARIVAGGNVGIGTTSPNEKLTVVGNINATENIIADSQFLFADGTASAPSIANKDQNYFITQDGVDTLIVDVASGDVLTLQEAAANNGIYIPSADSLGFVTEGTEKVRITPDGSVGIGTADPASLLHVAYTSGNPLSSLFTSDAIVVTGENTPIGISSAVSSNVASHRGVFKSIRTRGTLAAPTVPILNDTVCSLLGAVYDGNVPYGTAEIATKVDGAVSLGVAPQRIAFSTGLTNSRTERMSIVAGGNVGIGTTSPNEKLTVVGNINATENIIADSQFLFADGTASAPSIANKDQNYFITQDGVDTLIVDVASGDVLTLQEAAANNGIYIPSADSLGFVTEGTEKVRITPDGSVGIGTTTPNESLTVVGNISATGNIYADATILTNATIQTFTNPATATGDFLILNINGSNKALRLWDFTS